jgi:hypothetical protein
MRWPAGRAAVAREVRALAQVSLECGEHPLRPVLLLRERQGDAIHPATQDLPFTYHLCTLGDSVCRDLVTAGTGAWQLTGWPLVAWKPKDEMEERW